MKILIVSQYFWPESFRITDLALELVKRGHEVSILTGKPNYPQGKFYKGYGFFSHAKDIYKGIIIHRVPLFPRGKGNGFQLFLNYSSFVFFSCLHVLFHRRKYDVSLTFAISPIIQVYAALLHKKLYKSSAFLWLQDLWPESVSAAGKINNQLVMNLLNKMVIHIYNKVDKILVQSKPFIISIKEKGISEKKTGYLPNWAEDLFLTDSAINDIRYKNLIPKGFIVMFAGNIGESQDFESILKAAEITKNITAIKWVIIGDGRKKGWVENEIIKSGLQDTVKLMGRYPVEDMPAFFVHADLMLLTLKNEKIFSMTIPSKLQSYMAFGKPVVGMLDGIGANLIAEADCGYTCPAANYLALSKNIIRAFEEDKKILLEKGLNGKRYYEKNFAKDVVIENIINFFQE
jgi:glycosyltransferase involved in cell wall biosynthesis